MRIRETANPTPTPPAHRAPTSRRAHETSITVSAERPRLSAARTVVTVTAATIAVLAGAAAPALADPSTTVLAADSIPTVINNIQNWLIGILAALATLFFVIGGVRYVMSGGNPGEVEKAKTAFKSAALGYCLAILAPVVVTILQSIVGN